MDDRDSVIRVADAIAQAIARRDVATLRGYLAAGFTQRPFDGEPVDADGFLRGVAGIPFEIEFVRLERIDVDLFPTGALATGIQHARVRVDGEPVDDRRRFADWFVRLDGAWRIQAAADFPLGTGPS